MAGTTLILLSLLTAFLAGVTLAGRTATTNYVLETPLPIADYYVGQYSNDTYFAINGSNWDNFLVSDNASLVINSCLGNLTSGRTWKEKVLVRGWFNVDTDILVPSYTILEIDGVLNSSQTGSSAYIIRNNDTTNGNINIEIIGGEMDGNDQTGADSVGIYFEKVTDGLISNVYVHHISGAPAYGVHIIESVRVNVEDSRFDNCDRASAILTDCTDSDIENCVSVDSGDTGAHYIIFANSGKGAFRCNIVDCHSSGGDGLGAQIYCYATDCHIQGGVFEDFSYEGVSLGHESYVNTCTNIGVTGATIHTAAGTTGVGVIVFNNYSTVVGCQINSLRGIYVWSSVYGCSVTGNSIKNCNNHGVFCEGSWNVFSGNSFSGMTAQYVYAFEMRSGATNNTIIGNTVYNCYGGIEYVSGANGNHALGNTFYTDTTAIADSGSDNTEDANYEQEY